MENMGLMALGLLHDQDLMVLHTVWMALMSLCTLV